MVEGASLAAIDKAKPLRRRISLTPWPAVAVAVAVLNRRVHRGMWRKLGGWLVKLDERIHPPINKQQSTRDREGGQQLTRQ